MFPPQVMVHPQDYATGAPRNKRAQRQVPAKKWRPLPLVIAGLLLAGGATGVTLLLIHKPTPKVADLGGYTDRDTAVRETFRALAAGDREGERRAPSCGGRCRRAAGGRAGGGPVIRSETRPRAPHGRSRPGVACRSHVTHAHTV